MHIKDTHVERSKVVVCNRRYVVACNRRRTCCRRRCYYSTSTGPELTTEYDRYYQRDIDVNCCITRRRV